ncbi:MAG: 1-(5-phosphoribosyl)-5-[(5-phosphoribosylamino)methylideneamino]imidazole-4-carboxamide isomerase [Bacteroidetes bacterium]|nr:1-(5-phosphoribosyl)-5-[(5-phosphoribosylamino)methylideneamino]imidazole-4-carboxamide isomerase [Bacteroidota bacterium]MDA1120016.1 1-(5-phosphoribosyl)-5-[(5-phosphoribosylamino)methylideneamino]imidazole-4-carboxamide isomerase [Bacteroidota bacterium]
MHIIPAIDIIGGKCVRLTRGDYSAKKEYSSSPLDIAKQFEDHGLSRLHLVDLDGARHKKVINLKVLEKLASRTSLHIDFGGGVQSDDDLETVFDAGAKQVTAGSIAIKNPGLLKLWLERFGAEKIILGADVKDGVIAVSGWEESSGCLLDEFLEEKQEWGIKYVISTDVNLDGMLMGPSIDLYQHITSAFPKFNLIASGGVSSVDDLKNLKRMGVFGTIVGKAIYEGKVTLKELAELNNDG